MCLGLEAAQTLNRGRCPAAWAFCVPFAGMCGQG